VVAASERANTEEQRRMIFRAGLDLTLESLTPWGVNSLHGTT